jgi:hypothetical protein
MIGAGVLAFANSLARLKDVTEAPTTALSFLARLHKVAGDLSWPGWGALLLVVIGLGIASSELWWPRFRAVAPWLFARSTDLMPLISLRDHATAHGWAFDKESLQILDFIRALDEAGTRGLLTFYGRKATNESIAHIIRDKPRAPVPLSEWNNLRVSSDGLIDLGCNDNFKTALVKQCPYGEKVRADIFVEVKAARRWLKRHAPEFIGQNEAESAAKGQG